jgi:hypothetical protein
MKIGITISYKKGDSLFSNGIKQNVMNLANVFKNSKKQHDVNIINIINDIDKPEIYEWDINKIKTIEYNKLTNENIATFDLWIILAVAPSLSDLKVYRELNPNCKIVSYKCGNNYQNFVEEVIFGVDQKTSKEFGADIYDEIWHIPQQDFNNKYFYSTLYRTKSQIVPFVWDPIFINHHAEILSNSGKIIEYQPNKSKKTISVFEPNMSMQKNAIAPMLIAERLYHTNPELIEKVLVTNANKLKENKEFIRFVNTGFDLQKDGKIFFEARYPIVHFLSSYTDVVLSHQWGNDLNYAYLDAMYYGYPLVHNAFYIQDAGYHYEFFDYEKGAQQLKKALSEHDNNLEEYKERNRLALERYLPTYQPMIDAYDRLIDNLWSNNKTDEFKYDWKNNQYL